MEIVMDRLNITVCGCGNGVHACTVFSCDLVIGGYMLKNKYYYWVIHKNAV
jgi:hypothetical protein